MVEIFYPEITVDRVQNINLEQLIGMKVKGLILDIDNTLVPPSMKDADENAVKWIEKVRKAGLKTCIVSNASKKRVIKFNERLKIYAIHRASKPGTKAFMKATRLMGIEPGEAVVIGDQIFTDVYGGNKAGMHTILVKPIVNKEYFFIRAKRVMERYILKKYEKRNRTNE
ncbi:MAG TPA: YqeG family HAD IIIA-type phosphatase [Clostridia bacterium]|nr:YqeG family HAD IIIA-type phosphatase [Clostridia bacterium]